MWSPRTFLAASASRRTQSRCIVSPAGLMMLHKNIFFLCVRLRAARGNWRHLITPCFHAARNTSRSSLKLLGYSFPSIGEINLLRLHPHFRRQKHRTMQRNMSLKLRGVLLYAVVKGLSSIPQKLITCLRFTAAYPGKGPHDPQASGATRSKSVSSTAGFARFVHKREAQTIRAQTSSSDDESSL